MKEWIKNPLQGEASYEANDDDEGTWHALDEYTVYPLLKPTVFGNDTQQCQAEKPVLP